MASSIPYLLVSPPLNYHTTTSIHKPLVFFPNPTNSLSLKSINQSPRFSSPARRKSSSIGAGASAATACSTSYPFIGKVGLHRREGNFILLSYGTNPNTGSTMAVKADVSQILSAMLPFVVALTAIAALTQPLTFTWVSKELYAPALGGIMLSIGIKLSIEDFALAFKRPVPLSIGFLAQYVLKPVLGVFIAKSFGMSPMYYAGFVLMSCVAGAQLSSYASFLSKGDVALSILLTSSSTIASVVITPLLTGLLIGSVVPVDAIAMSKSILQVVLVLIWGLRLGCPLAINQRQILSAEGLKLIWPVLTFHSAAFTFGYWVSKLPFCRQEEDVSRTISLCMGMQSSTLAGLLATQFLGSSQAVPPTCSVVAMAIMGLCLASFWGNGYRIRDLPYYLFPQTDSTVNT
ncbi:hypothetical protein LXL04_036710 [Taraxacum kok-saghyz]